MIALTLGLLLLAGCPAPNQSPTAPTAVPSYPGVTPLALGPVTTFEKSCARCHGPQGASFRQDVARLPDDQLRRGVKGMMQGKARLKPTPAEIDAMLAYQRALARRQPFVCVTNGPIDADGKLTRLAGQASPGAQLELRTPIHASGITVQPDGAWAVEENLPAPPLQLVVIRDRQHVILNLADAQWSHAQP